MPQSHCKSVKLVLFQLKLNSTRKCLRPAVHNEQYGCETDTDRQTDAVGETDCRQEGQLPSLCLLCCVVCAN